MALTLYLHPLASFCHKVLIALYENATPFTPRIVDLGDEKDAAEFKALWPTGKIPLLHDSDADRVIPETSVMIEYVSQRFPGPVALIPDDPDAALDVRLWDRFYDLYVQVPMQKIVVDRIRPPGQNDPYGVAEARTTLGVAYRMIEERMASRTWAAGEVFTMADCAAAPALFFAGRVEPFPADCTALARYTARLLARPSCARAFAEAKPYMRFFPYYDEARDG